MNVRQRVRSVSPMMTLWLTLVWLALFSSVEPLIVIAGVLVAIAIQWFLPMPRTATRWRPRPLALIRLMVVFVRDVIVSGLQVTWIILSGRKVDNGIVRVDLRSSDPVHLTILSAMTSLVPGSIVIRIESEAPRLYLHILDMERQGGADNVRRRTLAQEERILRAIAPPELFEPALKEDR
ncbi:Na+/H+ antiporter subunit E [Schaalia vaccimaxillae]|uniref:Na+/H+ antiporter subunit E n=1 Tax=Schaalia vaccimaxillae TaxID=183916 RepID=UPI0003B326AD|nr:Na+/H+ antiporter subunit E [Schaalia vaccimaxillae]